MNRESKKQQSRDFEFIGLKKHTHAQRMEIINKIIVPILKRKLGKNFIAIAADGSYARNEDSYFSDIELMIFVKDKKNLPRGFGRIVNGILIEGLFVTEDEYYKSTLDVNEEWYISGSDRLMAIIDKAFIKKVQNYKVKNVSSKCFEYAKNMLSEIQESFGKLLTTIKMRNRENLFPVLADVVMQVLKLMAYINKTPYKTLSTFVTQARNFKIKPRGFNEFIDMIVDGNYLNFETLQKRSAKLFTGIEEFFTNKIGNDIYDSDLSTITEKK